ncbi:MAG: peptidylprolyl isomerase [Bacteroidota bacterium]
MIKQFIFFLFAVIVLPVSGMAQEEDPVLFSVKGNPVHVSEFLYIYSKTNRDKADFSKASLEEYLDLYTKFKLKVQRAKDMQLDTIPALKKELAGYRRQLADSYLLDKEVTEKLIKEAYERSQKDIQVSHIMVSLKKNANPQDTAIAYRRIMQIKNKLDEGSDFVKVAKSLSDDPSAKSNNGNLGYFTSPFPNGFYDFETAAYSLQKGQYSSPVRTPIGYHIIRVEDIRPARGEMEAAHILVRGKTPEAKVNIDTVYSLLQKGQKFDAAASIYSSDKKTAEKGGYIGFFGIGKYEKAFEDAAFALTEDGEYSKPIQTLAGWHIIKRVSRKPMPDYDKAKARLKAKIQKDARFELAKEAMVDQIKDENGFKAMKGPISRFGASLDKEFLTYRWKAPKESTEEVILALGDEKRTMGDFTAYLEKESRKRMQMARTGTVVDALTKLYNDYVTDVALKYEERNLEAKYPDFKALMREYEEGILLFEITKQEVWDKASQDTVGLKNFHNKNRKKYMWGKRAVVSTYTLDDAAHLSDKIGKFAQKNAPKAVLAKYNKGDKEPVLHQETIVEKGRNKEIDALSWKAGTISEMKMDRKNKQITFMKIERILEPSIKKLNEARGYVVADYQDYLEKQWLSSLKKAYKVQTNKRVFKSLVKK